LKDINTSNISLRPLIIDFIDIPQVFINESNKRLLLYNKKKYNVTDYVYNEEQKVFTINTSQNRNYSSYIINEKIEENKHISGNDQLFDKLFREFNSL
jgi:hypothetical protein